MLYVDTILSHTGASRFKEENMENNELNAAVPKKKSKKGLIAGCVTGGVLLVGGGTFAILAATGIFNPFKTIQNTIDKATKSPLQYYKQVEGNYIDDSIDTVKEYYDNSRSRIDPKQTQMDFSASVVLESGIKSLLNSYAGSDLLNNLDSLGLNFTYGGTESEFNISPSLLVNDEKVFTGNAYINVENGETYVNVPEISDEYIDLTDAVNESLSSSSDTFSKLLDSFEINQTIYPAYETLTQSIDNYKTIYFDNIKNVEESTEKLEASGVSAEYTTLTVKLTGEEVYNILKSSLEAAKDDAYVKEFIDNWNEKCDKIVSDSTDESNISVTKIDYDEYTSGIDEALSSLEERKDILSSYGDILSMKVYVDGDGEIIGRNITVIGENSSSANIKYAMVISGGKYGCDFSVSVDDKTYITVTGGGNYDLSNMDGDFTATFHEAINNEDLNIYLKYENGNTIDYLKGIASGDLTFTTDMKELKDYYLKLSYSSEENNGNYKITVGQKDIDFASVKIAYAISNEVNLLKPTDSSKVIKASDTAKLTEYIQKFDPEKILANIKQKTGVTIDIDQINNMWNSLGLEQYIDGFTDSDSYDYDIDDDYNWDDDFDIDDDTVDFDDDDFSFDDDTDDDYIDIEEDTDVSEDTATLSNKVFTLKYVKSGSQLTPAEDFMESTIKFNKDGSGYFVYKIDDSTDKANFKTSYLEDDFYVYMDDEKVGTYEDDIIVITRDSSMKLIYATENADLSDYE